MLNRAKPGPTLETSAEMATVQQSDVSHVVFGTDRVAANPLGTQLFTKSGGLVNLPQDPFLYKDLVRLGEGAHGTVFKGSCSGTTVAVKFMKPSIRENQLFEREAQIAASINHPRCVLLLGAFKLKESVVLVSEFVESGSLDQLLFHSGCPIPFHQKLKIAMEIAEGMAWLSASEVTIIHKDLKPHNILLTPELHCKIADFGLSCLQSTKNQLGSTAGGGTLAYMAPEILTYYKTDDDKIVTFKSDVYSFGVMLYEILTQTKFTEIDDWEELERYIMEGNRPDITSTRLSGGLQQLLTQCWACSPHDRPTFIIIYEALKTEMLGLNLLNQSDAIEFWKTQVKGESIKMEDFAVRLLQNQPCEIQPLPLTNFIGSVLHPSQKKGPYPPITLQHLGNLLIWFGEFKEIVSTMTTYMHSDWFHGSITRERSEVLLGDCRPGTFLVRLNLGGNSNVETHPLTISFVNSGKTLHVRLASNYPYFNLKLPLGGDEILQIEKETLPIIIEELKRRRICTFPRSKECSGPSDYIEFPVKLSRA